MDDHLPHRPMAEVEMADTLIRLLDCAGAWNVRLIAFQHTRSVSANRGEAIFNIHHYVNGIGAYVPVFPLSDLDRDWLSRAVSEAIFAVMSYCFVFDYDLLGAYEEKMEYNRNRADHKLEARRAAGGKAF